MKKKVNLSKININWQTLNNIWIKKKSFLEGVDLNPVKRKPVCWERGNKITVNEEWKQKKEFAFISMSFEQCHLIISCVPSLEEKKDDKHEGMVPVGGCVEVRQVRVATKVGR